MGNVAQKDYWRSASGDKWADMAERLDPTHAPVTDELVRRADIAPGMAVLDVGCGAGTSARALARAGAHVTGIDLSARLLDHARASMPEDARAVFVEGDAQDHRFGAESFDRIVSQFGVMFFDDPVSAFANLLRAARPGATMVLAAWASAEENPWFSIPSRVAADALGPVETDPDAPSPTAFRDIGRVTGLIARAGWADVAGEPVPVVLAPPGSLDGVADQATRLGGAARVLRAHDADEAARAGVASGIARALCPYATPEGVRVPAVLNFFAARAPG